MPCALTSLIHKLLSLFIEFCFKKAKIGKKSVMGLEEYVVRKRISWG
jgi:hypothetical protein